MTTIAPIFLQPGAVTPLRVAAVGTTLNVLKEDGEWAQVEFQDPQWGLRVGWVQTKLIQLYRPELQPMDLSVKQDRIVGREPGDTINEAKTVEGEHTVAAGKQPLGRTPISDSAERNARETAHAVEPRSSSHGYLIGGLALGAGGTVMAVLATTSLRSETEEGKICRDVYDRFGTWISGCTDSAMYKTNKGLLWGGLAMVGVGVTLLAVSPTWSADIDIRRGQFALRRSFTF